MRNRVVPKGKNHGFSILLDWSGSMSGILLPMVKQAISLAYFCRKMGIPFDIYNFNDGVAENKKISF
jgi:inner membrane protein involved in colicin E2 resistance